MDIRTLLIYGEERARIMAECAECAKEEYRAAQFRELAELLKAIHKAFDDFLHDIMNND